MKQVLKDPDRMYEPGQVGTRMHTHSSWCPAHSHDHPAGLGDNVKADTH
jgi:hypothetical protein